MLYVPNGVLTLIKSNIYILADMIIWLIIGYMWLFVHRPFEIWTMLATFRFERLYMIITIACWLASSPKLDVRNRLHIYFGLFILVMIVSWLLSPYQAAGDGVVEYYLKYAVFYIILVTTVRNERDLRVIIAGFLGVTTLWMAHSLREYYCGNKIWAQGINRLVPVGHSYDFNDFAGLIVCSLPFAWLLWHQWTGRWKRILMLGYVIFACFCIVLTGSRMGFAGMMLAGVLASLASPKRWRLLALSPVLFAVLWIFIPENQKDRYYTLFDPNYKSVYGASSIGNYRYSSLETALVLLDERPLLGFGPNCFGQATGQRMMPHNLYGQLLAELGLAGTVAFGLILLGVAQNALEARRIVRSQPELGSLFSHRAVLAMSATVLLLAIMAWGFNFLFWHVWLWFGGFQVCALHCLRNQAKSAALWKTLPFERQSLTFADRGI
jgi:O-antigen ligase